MTWIGHDYWYLFEGEPPVSIPLTDKHVLCDCLLHVFAKTFTQPPDLYHVKIPLFLEGNNNWSVLVLETTGCLNPFLKGLECLFVCFTWWPWEYGFYVVK